jgi:hypothetical protein
VNCWEVLGIPATGDTHAIKKSYTRLLKKFPPESDPEGFKNLRAAYEEARLLVQYGLIEAEPAASPDAAPGSQPTPASSAAREPSGSGELPEPAATGPIGFPVIGLPDPPPPPAMVAETMARIKQDFPVHAMRESEAYWKELADSELLWDLSAKAELGIRLFHFLGETYLERGDRYTSIHVPRESWKVLDESFGWLENEGEWYARFPENLANAVLDRIRAARDMALSTDLKGAYQPVRDLLIEDSDPMAKHGWVRLALTAIIAILGVLALNGVFFRCS